MKKFIVKELIVLTVIILVFLGVYVNAKIRLNDTQMAFAERNNQEAIERANITGAILAYEADSYINLFLAEIERGENYTLMIKYIDFAIIKLCESYSYYSQAYAIGHQGYLPDSINKFKNYDYSKISQEFGNPKLYSEVSQLFKNGDILGLYKKNVDYNLEITVKLKKIKTDLAVKKVNVDDIQSLNILMYKIGSFGNYSTRLTNKVLK
jgi:hypothetical protein